MKTTFPTTNKKVVAVLATGLLVGAPLAQADSFTGFTIDFVDIENAGNADDGTGYGGVGYDYEMAINEVSEAMINAYNANSGGPSITLDNRGDDSPATSVSWNEAARFVNWLNTSKGHAAAYKFDTSGGNDNIALWEVGDAGYNASNPFRNNDAHYFLPTEDEWYKAAYFDGNTGTYFDYATGSDTAPTATGGSTIAGEAVYSGQIGPADITNAGGLSPYGTMAQNGNVMEWSESGFTAPNDDVTESRVVRGGFWLNNSGSLESSFRTGGLPTYEGDNLGFRVVIVPEPSSIGLMVIGAMGLLLKRRRG